MEEFRLGSRTLQPHRQLLADGERVALGKRALDILSALAEARGEIVTKDELLDTVWPGVTVEENALQVHIVALRKALGSEADRLRTIRGVGYQLHLDWDTAERAAQAERRSTSAPPLEAARTVLYHSDRTPDATVAPSFARPVYGAIVAWSWSRSRWIGALAVLALALLAGVWTLFGSELGLRPHERIPVVVRELTAATSGDTTETALASGITEELIIRLRRIPDLRVATAERDGSVPGGAFVSAYIVDGSIRRTGNQLRVTARLSNDSGEVLWSQTFDRPLADLFKVQEAVAATIADTLSVSLDVGANATEHGGTESPEAFAAYLQYLPHALDPNPTAAIRYLEHALVVDPNYVKALNGLAASYASQAARARTREQAFAHLAKADEAAARAIRANPDLWIGYASRGWIQSVRKDFRGAQRSFQRVMELDEIADPERRATLASYSLGLGRTQEALSLLASNELVDPIRRNDPLRIGALLQQGRAREAIDLFERIAAVDPGSARGPAAGNVFWAHLTLGDEAQALAFAEMHLPALAVRLRAFKAETELPNMSRAELSQWAQRRYGDGGNLDLAVNAAFASYYGETNLAIELLRLSEERIGGFAHAIIWNPIMAPVRKTGQFEQLVADLGLVDLWRETGKWPDACRPVSATEIACD